MNKHISKEHLAINPKVTYCHLGEDRILDKMTTPLTLLHPEKLPHGIGKNQSKEGYNGRTAHWLSKGLGMKKTYKLQKKWCSEWIKNNSLICL